MSKLSPKAKIVALSAVVASTGIVAYASNEASKKDEQQSVDTANLIVEKISKDRVKLAVDNVGNAVKAFQVSLKIDGNVEFNDDNIEWLTTIGNTNKTIAENPVETDYILSQDKKEIDIFVASNSELDKKGSVLEICEIDLKQTGAKSNSSYKIVPNTDNGKVAFKSVDTANNKVEEMNMGFDDAILSLNTAPRISLKASQDSKVTVDIDNNIIKVKEGYDFNANAKSLVQVSDDEDTNIGENNITVTKVDTSKTGTHNVEYTVTDNNGESTKLNASVLVEPEIWSDKPTITGIPTNAVDIFTGDIFNPLKPDGNTEIIARDVKGTQLEVGIDYDDNFDINKEGTYTITYTAKDKYNNTSTGNMTLNVSKNEAPQITGADDKVINKRDTFNPKDGVSVNDVDSNVTIDDLEIIGNVNTSVAKEYKLTYKISDGKNTTTKVRKVTVNGEPTISGDLSNIILKNGSTLTEQDILDRIYVSDDIDQNIKASIDLSNVDTSKDDTYKVKITATDNNGLSTEKYINVIVTSKSVIDLPGSGDGSSKENSKKKQVSEESAISEISKTLSDLTKDYNVVSSKKTILDDVVYSIKVSSKPVAFRNITEEWYVDITVPKAMDQSSGGIVITQHQAIKVSSMKINGYNAPLKVGDTITLTTKISPQDAEDKKLMWQYNRDHIKLEMSDDSQSATITALADGISKVRAVAIDGSEAYDEIQVQIGEKAPQDTEKPQFIYNGKTEIKIANGMKFKVPVVTATDNVDITTKVTTTILKDGKEVSEIDTKVAGEYKIKYTTEDKAGNKAELIITVTVGEPISGVVVGNGDATTENTALEIESTDASTLKTLVSAMENGFKAERIGSPVTNGNKAVYTIKLSKKQSLITRLFNLSRTTETYYVKITVENKPEFTNILNKLSTGGSTTNPPVNPPINPSVPQTSVTKLIGERRADTAVKISKEGWTTSTNVILVNGDNKNLVDGLTAAPLASIKNAPILLSNNDKLPKETMDEIKRLKASNVIIIGGEGAIPQSVIDQVKTIDSKINVQRIGGLNRYETSLNIAKEIDKTNDITKVYIGAGNGEADALSISPVAGKEKSPIILAKNGVLDKNIVEYLKTERLEDAYFIGGESKLDDKVISQVNSITSKDVSNNRIEGMNRRETNAKVIEKFYINSQLDGVVVAKDLELVDALTVGPLAAKKDIPVVIATNELSQSQEDVLKNKKSLKIYETGGGIKPSVIDKLKQLLRNN